MKKGEPLVGQAGQLFDRILNAVGIPRFQTYLTNFCKTQLPNNDEKKLLNQKGWKHPSFGELQSRIIQELSQLRTDLIVLMGDTAMRAVLDDPKFSKITKFRGSVYRAEDFPHLAEPLAGKKILITNHPASALPHADPKNFYVIMTDLEKLLQLEDDPSVLDVTYTTHINPAFPEILDFLNEVSKIPETSFDIEANPRQTTCFAFTLNPSEAMCVPLVNNSGNIWTPEQELQIWQMVAQILEGSPGLIMQNGMFDMMFKLRTLGLKTSNFIFDTMLAQHLCWADLPKGLDFITSVYTYHPYYKDEGKQEHLKAIKDWNNYWLYNARDAIITHQVKEPLERELTRFGAWDTFNFLMRLHKPLAEMEYVGIRTNQSEYHGIPAARRRLDKQIGVLYNALERFAGKKININSPKQMKEYFYVDLGLKPYTNRKTGNLSVDDEALKRISRQGRRGSAEAKIVRKIRSLNKLLSNYFNVSVDPDHRLRCQYKIAGTETGRLASAGTFFGTGTNLQNVPPAFKKYLIPDQGNLLIEIDLAQAEAVVVAYVSQDANMIAGFESDVDVHTYNASQIFDKPMEEISKLERSMGKRVVHASNYAMGYKTFALNTEIPEKRAKELLEAYHARFPGLRQWHREVQDQIYRTRTLYNLFGRPKRFLGMIDQSLLRSAYAFIPQSTVAEQLNRGITSISEDPQSFEWGVSLNLTVHDSVLLQIPNIYTSSQLSEFFRWIQSHMEIPLWAKGTQFTIRCDAKLSLSNWKEMVEIKSFDPETIEAAYEKL
jgi:uracil-DNA glycosylase family 4